MFSDFLYYKPLYKLKIMPVIACSNTTESEINENEIISQYMFFRMSLISIFPSLVKDIYKLIMLVDINIYADKVNNNGNITLKNTAISPFPIPSTLNRQQIYIPVIIAFNINNTQTAIGAINVINDKYNNPINKALFFIPFNITFTDLKFS